MIKRGYPDDLPIRPAHALQLDWWIEQRNFINIWLPEGLYADDTRIVWFLLRDPTDLRWTHGTGGTIESRCLVEDRCEIWSRTTPREDGVDLTVGVTNTSGAPWPKASLAVCVQLVAAPDFRDPRLERTYFWEGGAWRRFDPTMVREESPGGGRFFGGIEPGDSAHAETPEIRVASRDGKWHLSHGFPQAVAVGGNCHEMICCVHANPVLGAIEPGQGREVNGWLRVRNEPVDAPPLR